MTPSQYCKQYGLNVSDVAKYIGKPRETLYNWHKDSPALFEAVVLGVSIKLSLADEGF